MGKSIKNTSGLPQELKIYFWDVEFDEITIEKHSRMITERILNYGNLDAVRWLFSWAEKDYVRSILKKSRNLNAKSRNFWNLILTPNRK